MKELMKTQCCWGQASQGRQGQTVSAGLQQPRVQCEEVMTQVMHKLSCEVCSLLLHVYHWCQQ